MRATTYIRLRHVHVAVHVNVSVSVSVRVNVAGEVNLQHEVPSALMLLQVSVGAWPCGERLLAQDLLVRGALCSDSHQNKLGHQGHVSPHGQTPTDT